MDVTIFIANKYSIYLNSENKIVLIFVFSQIKCFNFYILQIYLLLLSYFANHAIHKLCEHKIEIANHTVWSKRLIACMYQMATFGV